jgi:hypothetical protein
MTRGLRWRRAIATLVAAVAVVGGLLVAGSAASAAPRPAPTPAPGPSRPQPAPGPSTGTPTPAPTPTPDPAPGPTPPGGLPNDSGGGGGGLFDIAGAIRDAIVGLIEWIGETGLSPVLATLGATVLSSPDLTGNPAVRTVWTTSLVAANSVFVLLVVAAGFTVMSRETLQALVGVREVLPRIAVAGISTNVSLLLVGKVVAFTNALCTAIAGQGVDGPAAVATIGQVLDQARQGTGGFLAGLLILGVLVMAVLVLITFVLRTSMLVLLVATAPLALICHATPQSEPLAYTWWRGLCAWAAIQVGQSVILLATLRVFLTPKGTTVLGVPAGGDGLLSILVCLTMLWLLVKLPGWMRTFILGPLGQGRGLIRQLVSTVLLFKTLGAVTGLTTTSTRSTRRPTHRTHRAASSTTATGTATTFRRPTMTPRRPPPPAPVSPPASPSPGPSPVGPVVFSHAPGHHRPRPGPAGAPGPVPFTSPPRTTAPRTATARPSPLVFSHPPVATPPSTGPRARPTAARFSAAPPPPARLAPPRTPPPPPTFSSAPAPPVSLRRRSAPPGPIFRPPAAPPSTDQGGED